MNLDEMSDKYSDVGCVWAPETIYDDKAGKILIYFTMRFGTDRSRLYYMYVNGGFNKLYQTPHCYLNIPTNRLPILMET